MDGLKTVLHVGTLIDSQSSNPSSNMLIFITGERITEILEFNDETKNLLNGDFKLIDLRDFTVMSGMVDAHMHFFGVPSTHLDQMMTENDAFRALRASREASEMLTAGITSARCLGSSISPSLKRAIDSGISPGPRLIVSGQFICASNGTWDHVKVPVEKMRAAGMLADGVDELRQKVRERLREGASAIKIGLSIGAVGDIYHAWGDDPESAVASYNIEEILAATEEAHKNRIKVSAHCIGDTAVVNAVLGGVDVIEHGYPMSPKTRKMVAEKGILITSTAAQLFYHNEAAEKFGYSVVREYCGHGIGKVFHQDPQILHYGKPGTGEKLVAGMTFTIEPMINAGRRDIRTMPDQWTVKTKDRSLSAQWEHTLLVTQIGVEVLTWSEGSNPAPDCVKGLSFRPSLASA